MAITVPPATRTVTLSLDGQEVTIPEGTTIWMAAKDAGIEIPVALGPVVSVLGMPRGGTEARPHRLDPPGG